MSTPNTEEINNEIEDKCEDITINTANKQKTKIWKDSWIRRFKIGLIGAQEWLKKIERTHNIRRDNTLKLFRTEEKHKPTDLRNTEYTKQGKWKESHNQTL